MAKDESLARDAADVVAQQWAECYIALGVSQGVVSDAVRRIRAAPSPAARNRVERELRGFFRRLARGMLAIADPDARVISNGGRAAMTRDAKSKLAGAALVVLAGLGAGATLGVGAGVAAAAAAATTWISGLFHSSPKERGNRHDHEKEERQEDDDE